MSGGRHASDEEFEFEFDFHFFKNILLIVVILAIIAGVVFGTYKLVGKMTQTKTEPVSSEIKETPKSKYPVLGKIKVEKIEVEQPILDSGDDKALEEGVVKLYGENLNQERKFLYCRS